MALAILAAAVLAFLAAFAIGAFIASGRAGELPNAFDFANQFHAEDR